MIIIQGAHKKFGFVEIKLLFIGLTVSAIAVGLIAFLGVYKGQTANAIPPRVETPQETKQAEAFQTAGKVGDASHIQTMIQALQRKPQEYVAVSAMHSLALLGAIEAIPVLDQYIHGNFSSAYGYGAPYLAAEAQVAKARLLAEDAGKDVTLPASQADVKTRKFFEALGLSPAQLNTAVVDYFQHGPEETNKPAPLELRAMRELADIAYQGSYQNFTSLPAVTEVDFSLDTISSLKLQLAPLSHKNRVSWLIHDLSQTKQVYRSAALTQSKADELRLAVSEGLPANQSAAVLLQQMEKQRSQYSPIAFATLFSVLEEVGDKRQDALLLHFSHDTDPYIAEQARVSRQILGSHSQ